MVSGCKSKPAAGSSAKAPCLFFTPAASARASESMKSDRLHLLDQRVYLWLGAQPSLSIIWNLTHM